MILIKFTKLNNAAYLSHLDLLRCFNRIIRRAGLSVKYSQGFNPHKLLFFSPPLPLGVKSQSEFCQIATDCDPQEFMQKFNQFCIDGVRILSAQAIQKKLSFWQAGTLSEYELSFKLKDKNDLVKLKAAMDSIISSDELVIEQKQLRGSLGEFKLIDECNACFLVQLNCADKNLRADKFSAYFIEKAEIDVDFIDIERKSIII